MATQVNYEPAKGKNFIVKSVEEAERVLKDNNIIPIYHKHLKQVNICILMFEELETNRSYGEMFSDWADGSRNKINDQRLIEHLRKLKEEILTGIRYYTRLLVQKDKIKNTLNYLSISNAELEVKLEKVPKVSGMNKIGKGALYVGAGAVTGAVGGAVTGALVSAIGAIYTNYATLSVSIATFKLIASAAVGSTAVLGVGVCAGAGVVVGAVLMLIYAIAKNHGKKRGLKYQQIINLKESLEYNYLGSIRTNHEFLKEVYDTIDKQFKSEKIKMQVAKDVYSKAKQKSFKELKEEGEDDTICEKMSEKEAKKECIFFLIHHFESSREEAEKITAIVQTLY